MVDVPPEQRPTDYYQTAEQLALTRSLATDTEAEGLAFEFGEFALVDLPSNRVLLVPEGPPEADQDYDEGDLFVLYVIEGRLIIDDYIREFFDDPTLKGPWL